MKVVIVTSEITYVPNNYDDVLDHLLDNVSDHIAGVVLIKINKSSVIGKLPYLYVAGCRNLVSSLTRNIICAFQGRKQKRLLKQNIPYISTWDINDKNVTTWLEELQPDLIINMRTRNIFSDAVLQLPRLGCINVHHGLLPQQKGLFCDLHALASDQKTGFTIHTMTDLIDEGSVLSQVEVRRNNDYVSYLAELAKSEERALTDLIEQVVTNNSFPEVKSIKNSNSFVTTTPDWQTIRAVKKKGIIL